MSKITIADLEVSCSVGVTDEERANPQRLLVTVDMTCDFSTAAISDRIEKTINYQEVAAEVEKFCVERTWKLIEKLATNLGDMVLAKFQPQSVTVEVKKFVLPKARHVSVSTTRARQR
jgi:FolB domain-containing protein